MNGTVGPVRVITQTQTLRWRSVRFRSGPDRGSELNLPITSHLLPLAAFLTQTQH